jgi:hypothetical protein
MHNGKDERFEVFMAMNIQIEVFWVVTPYSVVVGYQCLGGPRSLHIQCEVEAARISETVDPYHDTTRHKIPK